MDNKVLTEKGKELAFLLRHDKKAFKKGIIGKFGWRKCDELIENHGFTYELLEEIVKTNDKRRYEFNCDGDKIRARQGHSIPVDMSFSEYTELKDFLYHGTDGKFINSIKKNGIRKQTREYVHLSGDLETAENVGKRHGNHLFVIKIDSKKMMEDGVKIYLSTNDVYLTDYVDPKYFKKIINYENQEN